MNQKDNKKKNYKMTRRRRVQKFTFGSLKYEHDQQRRKSKEGVSNAAEEQPAVTLVESRQKYEANGRKFEGGRFWTFLAVSDEKREKISIGSEVWVEKIHEKD